ncbi:hypothetical protein ACIQF6_28600 [Kitasatospora sp. NPDC092948]|uniref:hypothetical protein n=1 Tax=Kitasatospora sp. NPDC092948 TaxID=3364088 RepID=UPI0037F2AAB5
MPDLRRQADLACYLMAAAAKGGSPRFDLLAEQGIKAAAHFGLIQPGWAEVGRQMRRPSLQALSLGAAVRLLVAAAELHHPSRNRLECRMLAVDRAETRLVLYLRLSMLPVPRRRRGGLAARSEVGRFVARLDGHLCELDTHRRDAGVAALARLGLGLVSHLVHGTDLPV